MVQCSKSNNKVPRPYPYVILSVSEISHLCLYVILSVSEISHHQSEGNMPVSYSVGFFTSFRMT